MTHLPRLHAFEFEDQSWLPDALRDGVTDYLQHCMRAVRLYHPAAPIIARLVADGGEHRIVDLCSGAGGPWLGLLPELRAAGCHAPILLTDRFPNRSTAKRLRTESGGAIECFAAPVDATRVPPELRGVRTMFTSFHHFAPEAARSLLRDGVSARAPIAIFEFTERKLLKNLLSSITLPSIALLLGPFVRPVRWSRLALTYFVPLVPLIGVWDGFVSNLRSYTAEELLRMANDVAPDEYIWESGQIDSPFRLVKITYLTGRPRR